LLTVCSFEDNKDPKRKLSEGVNY